MTKGELLVALENEAFLEYEEAGIDAPYDEEACHFHIAAARIFKALAALIAFYIEA